MDNNFKNQSYEHLQTEHNALKYEYDTLKKENENLKVEYDKLKAEHDTLKIDFSENIIIQSMNEMKDRYERLVQSSVPNHKYNLLYERYTKMVKHFTACTVLLDYIYKQIKQVDRLVYTTEMKQLMHKIDMDITTTKNLLEDSIEKII